MAINHGEIKTIVNESNVILVSSNDEEVPLKVIEEAQKIDTSVAKKEAMLKYAELLRQG